MRSETYEIGPAPAEEDCAQVGITDDYDRLNRLECQAYIAALKKVHGEPPDGGRFTVKASGHDFGTYREAAFVFDPSNPDACDYAAKVECGLGKWQEANFWPPVIYLRGRRPVHVISDVEQLDRATNPTGAGASTADAVLQLAHLADR